MREENEQDKWKPLNEEVDYQEPLYPVHVHSYYKETIKNKPTKKVKWKKFLIGTMIVSVVGGSSVGVSLGMTIHCINQEKLYKQEQAMMEQAMLEQQILANKPYVEPLVANGGVADIAANIGPSIVSIQNSKVMTTWLGEFSQSGLGSGVIFEEDADNLYMITNEHVIQGATTLAVTFLGNEKVEAKLVGADKSTDIAVVCVAKEDISPETLAQLKVAPIGDSSTLEVGDVAIAIGNPLSEAYHNTVTVGVVSALDRELVLSDQQVRLIQTDAAINSGNSGGALVGPSGEVMGINTVKLVDSTSGVGVEGMGFALPMNDVMPIVNEIMEKGHIARPSLGIMGQDLKEMIGDTHSISVGVIVREVIPGSSADLAGIEPGDIILAFDDQKITTIEQLKEALANKNVGDEVTLRIIRDTRKYDVSVKLREMPDIAIVE